MTSSVAHLYATLCLATVFFQIGLIAGLPLGRYTQGGQHDGALPLSGRLIAAVSIPILLWMALSILSAAEFPGLDWPRWMGWMAFAVTCVICLLNWITPSEDERRVWGPVTTIMAALALVVMTA